MNFDSFFPDILVGLTTGLMVAVGVFFGELAFRRWRIGADVEAAQQAAVNECELLLGSPIRYGSDLKPRSAGLVRARELVRQVPLGKARQLVAGYYYLQRVVDAWTRLSNHADAIEEAVAQYERSYGATFGLDVKASIRDIARFLEDGLWSASETGMPGRRGRAEIEGDEALRSNLGGYLRQRRFLEAYREAFEFSSFKYRETLSQNLFLGLPRGPFAVWRSRRALRRTLRTAARHWELCAFQIPLSVSGGYIEPHPDLPDT